MFLFLLLRYIDFYVAKWYNEPESGDVMIYTVDEIKQRVEPVAKKYDIEKVYLFGSYARGDATEESDIDLRIDGDQKIRSLIDLSGLFLDFENALQKSIDVVTTDSLRQNINNPLTRRFIHTIKKEEELIYVKHI